MARQRVTPQSGAKLFESYTDFTGGLNSETSNERLRENEFPVLDNVDLSGRGSAKRRTGRTLLQTIAGTPQGMAYFYRPNQAEPDVIVMSGGKIWVVKNDNSAPFELPIQDVQAATTLTFQTTKPTEAVQYNKTMYLATGTKLCEMSYSTDPAWAATTPYLVGARVIASNRLYECTKAGTTSSTAPTHIINSATDGTVTWKYIATVSNGWYAKVVEAYKPTQMEFIYIGSNALATDPTSWVDISDELGVALSVKGIAPDKSSVAKNIPVKFTAYAVYTSGSPLANMEYKWEYKKSDDTSTTWLLANDYAGATVNKTIEFNSAAGVKQFDTAVDYDVRVTIRKVGTTTPFASYVLTNFTVTETAVTVLPFASIQTCTKIMLHWDRIMLYGDTTNPYQIYISDLNAPQYFPTTNTISFDIGKQEALTAIIRFRDYLVMFTKTTIHSLTGKSPDDYSRQLIHDGIGCVAGRTAAVTGNNIMFLSDEGVYQLRPNQYVLETLNVARGDQPIKSKIFADSDACALVFDSQYWICFPQRGYMYRYYYEEKLWVRDISSEIKFTQIMHYGNKVLEIATNGKLFLQNNRVYEKTDKWTASTAITVGTKVINGNTNVVYECTVAGTTGLVAPTHLTGTATDGTVTWKYVAMLYADGPTIYDMTVQSKYLDLSMSFNYKKLKKLYILAKHFVTDVALKVKVEADTAIALTPDSSYASVVNDQVVWNVQTTPNFNFFSGTTVGTWALGVDPLGEVELSIQRATVSGKCRRTRITFIHSDNVPCEIYGFGLEFKEKKV